MPTATTGRSWLLVTRTEVLGFLSMTLVSCEMEEAMCFRAPAVDYHALAVLVAVTYKE